MQCSESSEWMSLYLDGLLSQEQILHLQAHLAYCEACRKEWEVMRWLSSLLKAEPVSSPAPDFTAKVAIRLRQREVRRRRLYSSIGMCIGSFGLWALAGAALLLVLTVLWQPLIRIVLFDVGYSLVHDVLSISTALCEALYSIANALATQPTGLFLLSYVILALGLTALWTRVVFRRWGHMLQ